MKTLARASACPACGGVHGDAPAWWPTCPTHGHWLHERLDLRSPDGYVYGCLECKHTQIQTERITMTTDQAAGAALAIRDGQDFWDNRQLAALQQLGVDNAPKADLAVFLHRCQVTGLDPFAKQIRLRKDRQKVDGQWVDRWSIETEIDGYRVIAHRAAKRDGVTLSYGPTKWYDADGNEYGVWFRPEPPAAAAVTVYRDNKPFPGVARFLSFAQFNQQGQPMANWRTMPDHMVAKCAEAQALRKAFPHDLDGIQTAEEAAQAPAAHRAERVYSDAPQPPIQGPPGDDAEPTAADWKRLEAHWKRLGISESEEQDIYLCKLASKDHKDQVTTGDVALALDVLKGCEDIGALNDECAVEAS